MNSFDALLIVSFGGPEKHEDVLPFLENVLRGKNVPRERMLEVAEHYYHFDGRSPINEQTKELIAAVEQEFRVHGVKLPGLLGKPQLVSVPGGYAQADAGGWHSPRRGAGHIGVRVVLRMQAVS